VALLGALLTAGYRRAIDPRLDDVPAPLADRAREGIAGALDAAGPSSRSLVRIAQEAFVDGWQQAMWVGVGVMAALLVAVLVAGPRPSEAMLET
jgi:hypothetical protein